MTVKVTKWRCRSSENGGSAGNRRQVSGKGSGCVGVNSRGVSGARGICVGVDGVGSRAVRRGCQADIAGIVCTVRVAEASGGKAFWGEGQAADTARAGGRWSSCCLGGSRRRSLGYRRPQGQAS